MSPGPSKRTKILATLGPASSQPAVLEALLRAGANAFRLNCSHASLSELAQTVRRVRRAAARAGAPASVVLDLQGPRLRTGRLTAAQRFAYLSGGLQWLNDPMTVAFTLILLIAAGAAMRLIGWPLRTLAWPVTFAVRRLRRS